MQGWKITSSQKKLEAQIVLPASKSLSNRTLILQQVISQLTYDHLVIKNLSEADDTQIMKEALMNNERVVNIKNAGTCMRFLTAYYAATPGSNIQLNCDERMQKRPIANLVKTLKQLGADITYTEKEGFPPLYIKGKKLNGGEIFMEAHETSQFVSAMLLVAPLLKEPLQINVDLNASSVNYIHMTVSLMLTLGFSVSVQTTPSLNITVENQLNGLKQKIYEIEADWSSAAFIYEAAALVEGARIALPGLSLQSTQGDKKIADLMLNLGVKTTEYEGYILLEKTAIALSKVPVIIDLKNYPDLAPPLISTVAALGSNYTFTGLESLKVKESDRLIALQQELSKLGYAVKQVGDGSLQTTEPIATVKVEDVLTQTNDDHRLAMCFALLAFKKNTVFLSETGTVIKSFPGFWNEIEKCGLIKELIIV
ncbi:MAG: 3-phosphoshikimate 1-carboxyvinyltransferase [Bacteroidia bacterium]|nr:3-phosphoshikimate 1-carboxyvinyltransferase [Bacteroidia bacterium]